MAVEAREPWLQEIVEAHLPGMRPEIRRTFRRLGAGKSRKDIAEAENVEDSTVKRWIDTGTAEIESRLTTAHAGRGELRGLWIGAHQICCLTEASAPAGVH